MQRASLPFLPLSIPSVQPDALAVAISYFCCACELCMQGDAGLEADVEVVHLALARNTMSAPHLQADTSCESAASSAASFAPEQNEGTGRPAAAERPASGGQAPAALCGSCRQSSQGRALQPTPGTYNKKIVVVAAK